MNNLAETQSVRAIAFPALQDKGRSQIEKGAFYRYPTRYPTGANRNDH